MTRVDLAHGMCSILMITNDDDEEEEVMFPAGGTNCPGLTGFPGFGTFSAKARKSQANQGGWPFSLCIMPRLITSLGVGRTHYGDQRS